MRAKPLTVAMYVSAAAGLAAIWYATSWVAAVGVLLLFFSHNIERHS